MLLLKTHDTSTWSWSSVPEEISGPNSKKCEKTQTKKTSVPFFLLFNQNIGITQDGIIPQRKPNGIL